MGEGNPMAGSGTMPMCIAFDNDNKPIKLFKFPYQITEFFDIVYGKENHKNHSVGVGNISKALKAKGITSSRGFLFKEFNKCSKEIQDIVQINYESNLELSKENQ